MPDPAPYNLDPMLKGTPLGDLEVVVWGGELAVAIKDRFDPSRPSRVIHMVSEGGVLAALYGKAFWMQRSIQAIYDAKHQAREAAHASESADRCGDLQRGFNKWLGKEGARDALIGGG